MSDRRSADLGVKLAEHMTGSQTVNLGARLFECMLSHHLQNMMDEVGIKKTDVLGGHDPRELTGTVPLYHGGHWLYESKKGKISLAYLVGRLADPKFSYEIYSWDKLFHDVERFETQEKAERRIIEVLA